jgi:hypothetical protein
VFGEVLELSRNKNMLLWVNVSKFKDEGGEV